MAYTPIVGKLAVGIITWADGKEMLDKTVESLGGIADELLIADGVIRGVDRTSGNLAPFLDFPAVELRMGEWFPDAHISSHVWDSQSVKRTWLLEKARSLRCDWLLQIDADERLHNGDRLKAWLPTWGGDAFPIPFQVEPWQLLCATWKCIRVGAWTRVVAGGAYIEHVDGTVYCVVPPDGRVPDGAEKFLPLLTHHPDERPPGRRDIRLGELENSLEPPPPDAPSSARVGELLDVARHFFTKSRWERTFFIVDSKYHFTPGLTPEGEAGESP